MLSDTSKFCSADDKISVIMPHFSNEKFLRFSIESILNQTYKKFQLIFIDDCSPSDDWYKILQNYTTDERLKIYQTNQQVGPYRIKNKIIQMIDLGNYIAFQDSDDISLPSRFSEQLLYIKEINADIVGTSFFRINEKNETIHKKKMKKNANFWLKLGKSFVCHHPTILLKTSVFGKLQGFDGETNIGADSEFIYRASHLYRIRNHSEYLYKYRLHASSLTESKLTGHGSALRKSYIQKIKYLKNLKKYSKKTGRNWQEFLKSKLNNINFLITPIKL